jgi:hypothetical protein
MDDDQEYSYLAAHQGIEAAGLEKAHISGGFPGKAHEPNLSFDF